jgi:hypothetical protein
VNPDDEEQFQPPPVEGRGAHFGAGLLSGGEVSPGLAEMARRYKAETPTSYRPGGTSNGMSAGQFQATLGGLFPVQNGSATDTYNTKKYYGSQS